MQVFEKRLKRQFPHSVRARGKTILEELSSIQLFTGFENPALFSCYVAAEKRAGFSNPVKNCVLKKCSNIFLLRERSSKVFFLLWSHFSILQISVIWTIFLLIINSLLIKYDMMILFSENLYGFRTFFQIFSGFSSFPNFLSHSHASLNLTGMIWWFNFPNFYGFYLDFYLCDFPIF